MRIPGRYAHARHILVGSKSDAQAILNEITNARKPLEDVQKNGTRLFHLPHIREKR